MPQVDLLLGAGVPAVIATSRAIRDCVARDFAIAFYEALTVGREAEGLRPGQTIAEAFASAAAFVKSAYQASGNGLLRNTRLESRDVHELSGGLPWLLRPSPGAEALRWSLFEDDPLFGLPPLPDDIPVPQAPVRQLQWFRRDDARIFFGRGRAIRAMYDAIVGKDGPPIILYYGATGVGKSSVLHAGLVPRLEADHRVVYKRRNLERGLLGTLRDALGAGPEADIAACWRAHEQESGKPLIVILDQVEEAFTQPMTAPSSPAGTLTPTPPSIDPQAEINTLAEAVRGLGLSAGRPRGKLVLGFRKEWLHDIEQALAAFASSEFFVNKVPLDAMGCNDIREAVVGPARDPILSSLRLKVDDELPGVITHDLMSDPDARAVIAPTLQVILSQLWDQVKDNSVRHYTVDLYNELKSKGLLLRAFLDKQLKKLEKTHPEEVTKGFDLELLEAHTTAWGTANRRSWDKLGEQYHEQACRLAGLRERLKDLYMLVDPPADPGAVRDSRVQPAPETSLVHDALAPLVQEKHRASPAPAQRARRLLENSAGEWKDKDKTGTPLASADLALVEEGLPWIRSPEEHEWRLIQASREAEKQRVDKENKQKAREQSLTRWRNRLAIAAGVGLVVASVFAVIARLGWVEADKQTVIAKEALEKQKKQTDEAKRQARIAQLRLQHNVLSQVDALALTDPLRAQDLLRDPVVFPDEDRDFAWGFQYGRCLWVRTFAAHHGGVSVAFSSDGRTLATGGSEGNLRFWDAAHP